MFENLKDKLPKLQNIPRLNLPLTVSSVVAFVAVFWLISVFLQRTYSLNLVKTEINKIQESFLEIGWDMAYEEANTSAFSPFYLIKFKNFKIYSLDGKKAWSIPEFKIDASLIDSSRIKLSTGREQQIDFNGKNYPAEIPVLKIEMSFDREVGLKEISLEGLGFNIQGLATIDSVKLASQRMAPRQISELTPFFENHIEFKGINISEDISFPLLKKIDRLYANANIIGIISNKETYSESIDAWLRLGGIIDIRKLIIDWQPLVMVARGDLYFNDKKEPNLHLNTSSKGLAETLDRLQDSFLERKGIFVAKILLNNKSFKLNKEDRYYTVTTPININSNQMLIENIPVKKF